jgi:hypothetical protein
MENNWGMAAMDRAKWRKFFEEANIQKPVA